MITHEVKMWIGKERIPHSPHREKTYLFSEKPKVREFGVIKPPMLMFDVRRRGRTWLHPAAASRLNLKSGELKPVVVSIPLP